MKPGYLQHLLPAIGVAVMSLLPPIALGAENTKGPFSDPDVAALAEAAKAGDCEQIEKLVARNVNVNSRGEKGVTPLMYCIWDGNAKGFERLLIHGADPNLEDDHGEAAIHLIARVPKKGAEFLKLALAHGADPDLRTGGMVSLAKAALGGAPEELSDSTPTPIFYAIGSYNPENVRILVKAGADLSVRGVNILVERGADLRIRGDADKTPLMYAASIGSYDAVLVLLEAGADFRARDALGLPFSHYFTDDEVNLEYKHARDAVQKKCREFMEKKGVDFRKEKIQNDKDLDKRAVEAKRKDDKVYEQQMREQEAKGKATGNPAWGNTAQDVATIRVPAGTKIYEGFVAPQGNLLGGGSQVYIPKVNPNWLVPNP